MVLGSQLVERGASRRVKLLTSIGREIDRPYLCAPIDFLFAWQNWQPSTA
jgi:hypothetical protein